MAFEVFRPLQARSTFVQSLERPCVATPNSWGRLYRSPRRAAGEFWSTLVPGPQETGPAPNWGASKVSWTRREKKSSSRDRRLAMETIRELFLAGSELSPGQLETGLRVLALEGKADEARFLLERSMSQRIEPTVSSCGIVIAACGVGALGWPTALQLMEKWCRRHASAKREIFIGTIVACSPQESHGWEKALRLLEEMRHETLEPDANCFAAAMTACCGLRQSLLGNKVALDVQLIHDMEMQRVAHSELSLHCAFQALALSQLWSQALTLLVRARLMPIQDSCSEASVVAFSNVVHACSQALAWESALQLLAMSGRHVDTEEREVQYFAEPWPKATYGAHCSAALACHVRKRWALAARLLADASEFESVHPPRESCPGDPANCQFLLRRIFKHSETQLHRIEN